MSEIKYMEEYGIPVVHLLKGVLYNSQENAWRLLTENQHRVKEYLTAIGLDLHINNADGYAFVRQKEVPDEFQEYYPRLMQKRPLSYMPTLLCVLLRKRLLESDQSGTELRAIISLEQIKEMLRVFLRDSTNERKQEDKIESAVKKLVEFGFLLELKSEKGKYEVSRILNAYLDIEKLKEVQGKLEKHNRGDADEGVDGQEISDEYES
jgi:hypothetical protein